MSYLAEKMAALVPFRRRCWEAEELCIRLCHRIVWREYFRDAEELARLNRVLERARRRTARRRAAYAKVEAQP